MPHLLKNAQPDISGKIQKDYWVREHPGRPRTPKEARSFKQEIVKPTKRSFRDALESMRQYWIPGRCPDPATVPAVELKTLRADIRRVDSGLRLAWNPRERLWGVWVASPLIKTEWCKGWKLLFSVKPEFLDQRVLWKLYESDSSRFGGAKAVYDAFLAAQAANQVKIDNEMADRARVWAGEYFDYTRVKSFMPSVRPKGFGAVQSGGKFARHK